MLVKVAGMTGAVLSRLHETLGIRASAAIVLALCLVSSSLGQTEIGDKCEKGSKDINGQYVTFAGHVFSVHYALTCNAAGHWEAKSCRRDYYNEMEDGAKNEEPFYPGEAVSLSKGGKDACVLCNTHKPPSKTNYLGIRCNNAQTMQIHHDTYTVAGISIDVTVECEVLPNTPENEGGVAKIDNLFWKATACTFKQQNIKANAGSVFVVEGKEILCPVMLPPRLFVAGASVNPAAAPTSRKGGKGQAFKTQDERINGWAAELKKANGKYINW